MDERNIRAGSVMPTENYSDQPYVVKAKDGAWVMAVTTGRGFEGDFGQHVLSARSTDRGQTWETPVDVESANAPESSYAVLYATPYGRIYCFYNFNRDNVREIPADLPGGKYTRVDSLGHFGFKYSDDCGKSWSRRFTEIPVRLMKIDIEDNPTAGGIPFFWNVGKPVRSREGVLVPLYKIGHVGPGSWVNTEGVFSLSRNIDTERDPDKITWETLPDGNEGIHADRDCFGCVSEEHSTVRLSDGSLFTVFRTAARHPFYAISRDNGHTFSEPAPLCYRDGRPVFQNRAANFLWKCKNGKYLYWHNNVNDPSYEYRNPVFLSGAVEVPGDGGMTLRFSEPEVVLYDDDPCIRISYPDLIEDGGEYYITETQKQTGRVHHVDRALPESLWADAEGAALPEGGELLRDEMPVLPPFVTPTATFDAHGEKTDAGFAFAFDYISGTGAETVFDFFSPEGVGAALTYDGEQLSFRMSDGCRSFFLETPLSPGCHRVAILLDGGPCLCRFVIDGETPLPLDGRRYAFGQFDGDLSSLGGGVPLRTSHGVSDFRLYRERVTAPVAAMIRRGLGR